MEAATRVINPMSSNIAARSFGIDFVEKANTYNDPGRLTAMPCFELSSSPDGNNLHRVVIFRGGAENTSRTVPFDMFDSPDPEDLWKYMAGYEETVGGQVFAIPHNGNLSNGLMFSDKTLGGKRLDRDYAERRMRWEPLIEIAQMKGDGEAHPLLSPDDEFADFETWDVSNIDGSAGKTEEMLPFEYARSALKLGLQLSEKLGANPYKFGLSAASYAHTGLSTTR